SCTRLIECSRNGEKHRCFKTIRFTLYRVESKFTCRNWRKPSPSCHGNWLQELRRTNITTIIGRNFFLSYSTIIAQGKTNALLGMVAPTDLYTRKEKLVDRNQ